MTTILYHVAPLEIWSGSIKKSGLLPKKKKRGIYASGDEDRIYFFEDPVTAEDAMMNWFVEEFPGVRYFALIEAEIPEDVEIFEDPEIAGAYFVTERIPARNLSLAEQVDAGEE